MKKAYWFRIDSKQFCINFEKPRSVTKNYHIIIKLVKIGTTSKYRQVFLPVNMKNHFLLTKLVNENISEDLTCQLFFLYFLAIFFKRRFLINNASSYKHDGSNLKINGFSLDILIALSLTNRKYTAHCLNKQRRSIFFIIRLAFQIHMSLCIITDDDIQFIITVVEI